MPQSHARVLIHAVFSTKNRVPVIVPEIRGELFPYIYGIARNIGCLPIIVGGVSEHVHVLLGLSRTLTIADTVKKLKTASTSWLKEDWPRCSDFQWQSGYATTSVAAYDCRGVEEYIRNQEAS
jgi:REP element-mobilizing transposase RayT